MKRILLALAPALLVALFCPANAQPDITNRIALCDPTAYSAHNCAKPDASGNLPVTGTFSATLAGFTPTAGSTATMASVTTTSSDATLPATTDATVTNNGSVTAFIRIQVGAGTAVATDWPVLPGATAGFHIGSNTHISAITASSSTSLQIQGGVGLATGYGGGGSGGGSNAAAGTTGSAVPGSASYNGLNVGGGTLRGQTGVNPSGSVYAAQNDLSSVAGTTVSTGTGAQGAGTPRVTVATDTATIAGSAPGTAGTPSTNVVSIQGVASGTVVPVSSGYAQASATSGQNLSPIGGRTLNALPTDTTAQSNIPVLNLNGAMAQFPVASTIGGATAYTLTAANSTNATNVKASAGTLYHIAVYNNSATLAWVSFYNTAGTPTCGTSIVYQTMIPANSTSGAGAVEDIALGMNFSSGIGICVTTGIAGTGSVAASAYVVGLTYK